MWGVLYGIWTYRNEILLGAQFLASMRRTAREIAREYIRRRIAARLRRSLAAVGLQLGILALAWALDSRFGTLQTRLLASGALWGITLYNALVLLRSTVPELRSLRRTLRTKPGYSPRYLWQVAIVIELMQWNSALPIMCFFLASSSRRTLGASFSWIDPWARLWSRL
jgi:hypothetical protein